MDASGPLYPFRALLQLVDALPLVVHLEDTSHHVSSAVLGPCECRQALLDADMPSGSSDSHSSPEATSPA